MEANNTKAMRDALLKLDKWLYIGSDGFVHGLHDKTGEIERTIKAALSEPIRNCDVGTAEEQESRFHATGETYHTLTLRNAFAWAQMPYEEGGK